MIQEKNNLEKDYKLLEKEKYKKEEREKKKQLMENPLSGVEPDIDINSSSIENPCENMLEKHLCLELNQI